MSQGPPEPRGCPTPGACSAIQQIAAGGEQWEQLERDLARVGEMLKKLERQIMITRADVARWKGDTNVTATQVRMMEKRP